MDLILRNPGVDDLLDVTISWFASAPISVIVPEASLSRLPSGDTHTFSISISREASGALPGELTFEARYSTIDQQGVPHVHTAISAPTKVEAGAIESVGEVAKLEIRTALASLNEKRPGDLYLLITNIADADVIIRSIKPTAPEFIDLEPEGALPSLIPSGRTLIIPYEVSAATSLQPGKQLVLFDVELSWPRGERQATGNLVATQEVSVEVFGESAILGLISVPAFLLLPGALIVLSFELCLLALWRRSDLPLTATSAQFWLIAVPLSLLMAVIYPHFPGGQNYLLAYGFGDVVRVWMYSTVIGVLAFITWWGVMAIWRTMMLPKESDDATDILKKLGRRGSGVYLPRVSTKANGTASVRGYLIHRSVRPGAESWVGPRILLHFAPESVHREEVEAQLNRRGTIRKLRKILTRAGEGEVDVRFDGTGLSLRSVPSGDVHRTGREDLLVLPRTGSVE